MNFLFFFICVVSGASNYPFMELSDPSSPIIGLTRKRKDRSDPTETKSAISIGHPEKLPPNISSPAAFTKTNKSWTSAIITIRGTVLLSAKSLTYVLRVFAALMTV